MILNRLYKRKEKINSTTNKDPTKNFKLELTKLIPTLILHPPPDPQLGKFYLLPKIHKPNNPGQPIISNNNTLTEHLSHFIETLLKPYTQAANSFIKGTIDFLNKLTKIKTVPQNIILAILDVSSLYSNIIHKSGLKALKSRLPDNQLTDVIMQSTEFTLKHNYFNFGNQQFLQLKGTAMGTKMAPQYAMPISSWLTWKKTYKIPIINH